MISFEKITASIDRTDYGVAPHWQHSNRHRKPIYHLASRFYEETP
jgi:hypothetical protein